MILYAQAVYLDFPTHKAIPLRPIGIPPSVSQRKHVPLLSVVLSGLSFEDLRTCALVSRAFRFSAYAAAVHQLQRKYPGSRSNDVLSQYAHQTTNFWPYLNLRNEEAHKRRLVYEASFLHRAMQGICTIDDSLWSSPDNEKQITIAVRFLLTRLFFFVSIGHPIHQGGSEQLHSVLDAREIVKDEVWEITSRSHKPSKEVFYVLESTCEVIGSGADSNNMAADKRIREDWHMHINNAKENTPHRKSLMDSLQWSNYEEYTGGISKLWLKRVQVEGELGAMKLIVAKRYVMACVMGNSISGSWRSAAAMAHEFEGKTTTIPIFSPKRFKLNLYLPFHHHVESVHFLSRNGKALHPAVAVIQTPGREYYILKDNGMQIGCEEEGIAPVWMKLLPCTGSGCSIE
ncbi:hypothetical protein CPC08DRAFT_629338 [Agrocybe pediades]|nr:hypothetical protein CPC08DRAFT_629338 [Agrocybe pediades]